MECRWLRAAILYEITSRRRSGFGRRSCVLSDTAYTRQREEYNKISHKRDISSPAAKSSAAAQRAGIQRAPNVAVRVKWESARERETSPHSHFRFTKQEHSVYNGNGFFIGKKKIPLENIGFLKTRGEPGTGKQEQLPRFGCESVSPRECTGAPVLRNSTIIL